MEFLPEHWDHIKGYSGIYNITTCWDFTKLDNNEIDTIVSYIPKNNETNQINETINRIKYIWKYLNKSKLSNIYNEFKHKLCPFNPKWYTIGDIYPHIVVVYYNNYSRFEERMCEISQIFNNCLCLTYDNEMYIISNNLKK